MKFNENRFADNYSEIGSTRLYSFAGDGEEMAFSAQSPR